MKKLFTSALAVVAAAVVIAGLARPAAAVSEEQEIIEKARFSFERMLSDPDYNALKGLIKRAQGVLIIPNLLKGGFFFGAEGGTGVLLARTQDGGWSYPAFFTMGGGSFGLQLGAQASEVVLVIMNQGALDAIISSKVKLGADVGVAVGPVGAGVDAATTMNLDEDVYTFAKSQGLYGGITLEGTVVSDRGSLDENYYGQGADAESIILEGRHSHPGAEPLRQALAPY